LLDEALQTAARIAANAPIIAVIAALAALGAAFFLIEERTGFFSEKALPALQKFGAELKVVLDDSIVHIRNFVQWFQEHWEQIKTFIMPVLKFIETQVVNRINILKNAFKLIIDLIRGDWKRAWDDFKQILKDSVELAISPWVLAWETAKASLDLIWDGIKGGVESMVNTIIGILNMFLGSLEVTFNAAITAYNETIGRLPGVSDIDKLSWSIDKVSLTGEKAGRRFEAIGESIGEFNKQIAKRKALEFEADVAKMARNAGLALPGVERLAGAVKDTGDAAADAGPEISDWEEDVGGAGGAADEAAESALSLRAALELTEAMFYTAAEAAREMAGADVEVSDLIRIQISLLEDRLSSLDSAGEAEGLLAEAIRTTIQHLEDQIVAFEDSEDKMLLFGEGVAGPVTAAFQDMSDAISEAESALSGLVSVQTQEEADLQARISYWEMEAEKIDLVAGELRGLTDLEQWRLDTAIKNLPIWKDELEHLEETIAKYEEMKEEGERLDWQERKELETAQERIVVLEEQIARAEDTIKELEALAETETAAGKAAREQLEDIEGVIEGLEDEKEGLEKTKKAHVDEQNALIRGRPTIKEWIDDIIGMGIETGLYGQEMESIPPLLEAWWRSHGTMGFEVARTQNHLLLAQKAFVDESVAEANEWGSAWVGNAQAIVDAMNEAAGGKPAGESYQYGGYVRRTGMALLHAGEFVMPKNRTRETIRDVVLRPSLPPWPAAPSGSQVDARTYVSGVAQEQIAQEVEYAMRRMAFGLKGAA